MPPVPAIDGFGLGLEGAMREHGVIDSATHNAQGRGGLQRIGVFIAAQRDDGQPLAYVADKSIACSPLMRCLPGIRVSVE